MGFGLGTGLALGVGLALVMGLVLSFRIFLASNVQKYFLHTTLQSCVKSRRPLKFTCPHCNIGCFIAVVYTTLDRLHAVFYI